MKSNLLENFKLVVTPHSDEMHCTSFPKDVVEYLQANPSIAKALDLVISGLKEKLHPGHIKVELRSDDDYQYLAVRFRTHLEYSEAVDILLDWRSEASNQVLVNQLGPAELLLV